LKIPPFDELSSSLSDLGVEDRVVSPSTSFRINEVEPPAGSPYGLPSGGDEVLEDAFLNQLNQSF
jgi:hypothetical protein